MIAKTILEEEGRPEAEIHCIREIKRDRLSTLDTNVFIGFSEHSGSLLCSPSSRLSVQGEVCLFCIT